MFITRLSVVLLLACLTGPALAHELWIEPETYQVETSGQIRAALRNGQKFEGSGIAFLPATIARLELADGAGGPPIAVTGRMGDAPAIVADAGAEGLAVLIYQSMPTNLTYSEREKFDAFVTHKDLGPVTAHTARGLPDAGFKEVYTRYSKALVAVGNGQGQDRALGLETELVALKNPYIDAMDQGMPVLLTYQDAPRSDAQIEVFEKAPDGVVTVFTIRTDDAGIGVVPVTQGHVYMLDAVVLREPDADLAAQTGAVWESLWANLVFAVPG